MDRRRRTEFRGSRVQRLLRCCCRAPKCTQCRRGDCDGLFLQRRFSGRRRMRRMRHDDFSRRLVRETRLTADDFIYPMFVLDGATRTEPVDRCRAYRARASTCLLRDAEACMTLGIPAMALFPVVDAARKSDDAAAAWDDEGLVPRTVRALKSRFPDLGVITDVALDPYTSHGQDGLVDASRLRRERRDRGGARAGRRCATRAAGVDVVAPSDMMDGRIGALRAALDGAGFASTRGSSRTRRSTRRRSTARSAMRVGSARALGGGNKYTYQMDPANSDEALWETCLDVERGRRHGDGQARAAVPRHRPPREGHVRPAHRGLPGVR